MEIDDDDADDNNATVAAINEVNPAEAIAAPSVRGGLNPEAARLFRVYRTMANMLSERGYMVPKTMRELTPAQFKMKFGEHPDREALTVLVEKVDDEKNQLFVFFPTDEKVGVKPIKTFTQRMQAEGVVNAIMVLRVDITAFAKQALQEMSDNFRIEHFKESELLVDITQHTVRFATSGHGPCTCNIPLTHCSPLVLGIFVFIFDSWYRNIKSSRPPKRPNCSNATGSRKHSCRAYKRTIRWRDTTACAGGRSSKLSDRPKRPDAT
jgi:hypothetical protein